MTIDLASDFRDLLQSFVDRDVRFLVVGGYALAVHGRPRATGDLDVWIDPAPENAERAYAALGAFGAPLHELTRDDLTHPGTVFQVGVPPLRIDILTSLTGLSFGSSWDDRIEGEFEGVRFPVIGRRDLLANKQALGRAQDLADVARLEREG